jgi:hypothetical protein
MGISSSKSEAADPPSRLLFGAIVIVRAVAANFSDRLPVNMVEAPPGPE